MENPFLKSSLLLILRVAVLRLGMTGLLDDATLNNLVDALITIGVILWGIYEGFKQRQKLVTALATPSVQTEAKVEALVRSGGAASVSTPKHEVPA